jgi:fumarate reductase flavoprotein subunit
MVPIGVPDKWDYESDIIVVGAGTAGLPAAWVAADKGAKVCVLELLPYAAPSLSLINVGPAFAGTDVQKELGIDDSPEDYYKDGVELAKGDPELWRVFADNQLETYYWCQQIGMGFGKELFAPPAHRKKRGIWKKGTEMTRVLEKAAKEKGVEILFSHRAERLIVDPPTRRVLGLKVKVKDKEEKYFKAKKAVILTTGGFGRNPELVAEYGPEFVNWLPTMAHGHLGDGLKMALEHGAGTSHIGHAVCGSFAVDVDSRSGVMDFVGYAGGIFVNIHGKRFADEGMREKFYGLVSEEGMRQPGHIWFAIIDDKIMKTTLRHHMLHKAKPVQADTIEELAEKLGINPSGLKATIEKYNHDLDTLGYDSEFGRTTLEGCEGKPIKIDTPPFYGYKCTGATSSFKGGLKINTKMQVLNQYGEVIPSLYAAGELTGGLWGNDGTYLPCTMVTAAMVFGRLAAMNAVKEPSWL